MLLVTVSFLMLCMGVYGYEEKYDKVDVDKILSDNDLFLSYMNCFLDKGPCTADYAEDFKQILPEVLSTACEKCSDIQKEKLRKLIKYVFENKPEMAIDMQQKYDPDRIYEKDIAVFIASET